MPNTYVALDKVTVGTAVASVTFSSISSAYTDLVVVVSGQVASAGIVLKIQFNSDTASNYSMTELYGTGSSAASSRRTSQTSIETSYNLVNFDNGNIGNALINVMNYSNTTTYKTLLARTNSPSATYPGTVASVGLWRSTAAINSMTLFAAANFSSGSTFSLYGIANADQGSAKATGGIITEDSQYYYHTFAASGTFTPKQSLTADVLVVAGGGGGGSTYGGGGGAGGLLVSVSQSLTAIAYTCTVGAGGPGSISGANPDSAKGINSQFGAVTASVGGGGGGNDYTDRLGRSGGSGGGGSNAAGAAGTSGQGNTGGTGTGSPNYGGGGGGGAGAVGSNGTTTVGGSGGAGSSAYSSWGAVTGTGQLDSSIYYYAGGGGAGTFQGGTAGTGGLGGGGRAGTAGGNNNGIAGSANTGGGGGGGSYQSVNAVGGAGGSGLIIVRYAK
jgi:hypothetical protein